MIIKFLSSFLLALSLVLLLVSKADGLATPVAPRQETVTTPIQRQQPTVAFKHLYRHYDDVSFDSFLRCMEPEEFLQSVGYTKTDLDRMAKEYPSLLQQNVHAQLAPKVQFLVHNLGGGKGRLMWVDDATTTEGAENADDAAAKGTLPTKIARDSVGDNVDDDDDECRLFHDESTSSVDHHHSLRVSEQIKSFIPTALYFNCRLDRSVGPRHAYLQYYGLPHGDALWKTKTNHGDHDANNKLTQFLQTCHSKSSSAADFALLCNQWQREQSNGHGLADAQRPPKEAPKQPQTAALQHDHQHHTAEQVLAFEQAFGPGLIPCAKATNDDNDTRLFHPETMISLLLTHGANYAERDPSGCSPLHWAAGTGKVASVQALLQHAMAESGQSALNVVLHDVEDKHGATPFHWACCGVRPGKSIGCNGSYDVCRVLLEACSSGCPDDDGRSKLVNVKTMISNSTPLMWAAWAGSLPIVDLLAIHNADPLAVDSKGATVAHWAAAGGHVQVCQYLHDSLNIDFMESPMDQNGKSPMDIALEYDRQDVVQWIRETFCNIGQKRSSSSLQL